MELGFLALGAALLVAVVADLLWTTLWVGGGAGPLSARLMNLVWCGLRWAVGDRSRVLALTGPLLITVTFVAWIGLLWTGWTFVFASAGSAVVDTRGGAVSWADRLYFVAYTIFTLGIGDLVPREGAWQIATVLTTATGMLFITLGVSYVVSILEAVSRKRSFASGVLAIGTDPESFVRTGWSQGGFDGFDLTIDDLGEEINYLAFQYKAYPVLHYYHAGRADHSPAVGVAVFDEALTILRYGVPADHRPNAALLAKARASTGGYLDTLGSAFIEPADAAPPRPDLDSLREAGVPTVSDAEFDAALDDLSERRRQLLGTVHSDAREWPGAEQRPSADAERPVTVDGE